MFTRKSTRGQAIVLIVFAIIGLIAIVALAIDGGNVFLNRRSAQNAADSAALAGALAKAKNPPGSLLWSTDALARALSNNFNNDGTSNTVTVSSPPGAGCDGTNGPYAENPDYIQVIINSTVNTYFGGIIGINQLHTCVDAIVYVKPSIPQPLILGSAVAAVNCTGQNMVIAGGSSLVTLEGTGAFSNSSDPISLSVGKIENLVTPDGGLTAVGGISVPIGYPYPVVTGATQFSCPLPENMIPKYSCDYTYNTDFPPIKSDAHVTIGKNENPNNNKDTAHIAAGVYCLNGKFDNSINLKGDNVTFIYLDTKDNIAWQGNTEIDLHAPPHCSLLPSCAEEVPSQEPLTAGLLIFIPYNSTNWATATPSITLNGTSGLNISGSIYAPGSLINLMGDFQNASVQSQWVGGNVDMSGNLTATINYDSSLNYQPPTAPEISLTK